LLALLLEAGADVAEPGAADDGKAAATAAGVEILATG
jgi:hypothetical protein